MAATMPDGPESWSMSKDERGYKDYKVVYRVECDPLDGPSVIDATVNAAIPVGTVWVIGNEIDPWSWRRPELDISPVQTKEPNCWFDVTITFSNRPVEQGEFSTDPGSTPGDWSGGTPTSPSGGGVENPLLVPDRISGGTTKYTEEATQDRSSHPILNSAFERFKGPTVEFDKSRATVRVVQNRSTLGLATLTGLVNCLNSSTLWGHAARKVKFSSFSWEKKYYAGTNVYYERTLEFEVRDETFDRYVLDEGTMALNGHWDGDEWVLDNINQLTTPRKPTLTSAEDGLVVGSYSYRVSAVDANGETLASPPAPITLEEGRTVVVTWSAVPGAVEYNVYRSAVDSTVFLDATDLTFYTDDGTSGGTEEDLPEENTTGTSPVATNPRHFRRYQDKNGENARVILDGAGKPAVVTDLETGETNAGYKLVEYYFQRDFTPLGLPASL